MQKLKRCPEIITREVQSLCRLNMKVCIEAETNEICLAHIEMSKEEEIWHAR